MHVNFLHILRVHVEIFEYIYCCWWYWEDLVDKRQLPFLLHFWSEKISIRCSADAHAIQIRTRRKALKSGVNMWVLWIIHGLHVTLEDVSGHFSLMLRASIKVWHRLMFSGWMALIGAPKESSLVSTQDHYLANILLRKIISILE